MGRKVDTERTWAEYVSLQRDCEAIFEQGASHELYERARAVEAVLRWLMVPEHKSPLR